VIAHGTGSTRYTSEVLIPITPATIQRDDEITLVDMLTSHDA
jgi:hypothetical protein